MNKSIKLNEKLECKGYWWLPSKPENKIAGILTYTPNEKIKLELIGSFDSKHIDILFCDKKSDENIIHGITSDSKKVTLINCHSYASLNLSCPFPIVNYNCQFLILGKLLKDFEEECFYKAYVTIPELSHWCSPCALTETMMEDKQNEEFATTISFKSKSILINSTDVDENTTIDIKGSVNYQGDYLSPQIEQYTYISILKKDDVSIKDFFANIYLFEQFLSLATLQTINCSKIILYDRTLYQEYKDGKKFYHPIQLFYIQRDTNNTPSTKRYNYLFDYNSISQQYPQIIHKWYNDKENIAPIRAHLIDSIKHKPVFSSIEFLIVIQAIEGFCTRFRKETNLTTMLETLISEFSVIDKLKNDNINSRQVVDSRNYYSHFMNKSKKPYTLEGWELYNLTFKLRKFLICCILNFIGFGYDEINRLLNQSNNNLLQK